MHKHVRLVGRVNSDTGIGHHGWSFILALTAAQTPDLEIEAVATNKDISDPDQRQLSECDVKVTLAEAVENLSDVAIFFEVIGHADRAYHQLGRMNILYFAWDSTRVPSLFVDTIQADFDMVIVPTAFVKEALIDSGVIVDIVVLPLVVKEPPRLDRPPKDRLSFGFVGSFEERKNVEFLVDAFLASIGKAADLLIHLSYTHGPSEKLDKLISTYQGSNVRITSGKLDEGDFFHLLNDIDCFVSLSKGEGYSLIPREFMYLERPLVLSHSSAHRSIPGLDGIWFVESTIPYPALYPQIDNNYHGVFRGPYLEDAIHVLREVWKTVGDGAKSYPQLRAYARTLSAGSLKDRYLTVISPKRVIKSEIVSHISPELCLTLKSDSLIEKYDVKSTKPALNKHVVLANDGGFFSLLNRYVSILVHELEDDPDSMVIPDWRVSSLKELLGHENFSSFCYGTHADGNIYLKIFEPPKFDIPEKAYNDPDFLRDNALIRIDYNEKKEPELTQVYAYDLYKRPDFQNWRQRYHKYFAQHVELRPDLQHQIDAFSDQHFNGHYVLAAHIRHPSHSMEQPRGRLPSVEVFREHIDQQLAFARTTQDKPVRLFIASDQDSVIQYLRQFYADILLTTDATRSNEDHDRMYLNADASERQKEGFQIQHIMASNAAKWSVRLADEVIIDTWLLAKSDTFLHITSNIATAVSYINPQVRMVYCE